VNEELRAPCGNNMKTALRHITVKYNATLFPGERLELEKGYDPIGRCSRKLQRSCWEARKRGFNPRGLRGRQDEREQTLESTLSNWTT
jgi:hypothetical protein